MTYFRLTDDVEIPGRWHLGEVIARDRTHTGLWFDFPLEDGETVNIPITRDGLALDFSLTSFAVPVATNELATTITNLAAKDVKKLPARIRGVGGHQILSAPRQILCLDETTAEFEKWHVADHRTDLVGHYRMVSKLAIDPSLVPRDAHFFRVARWPVAIIVSEQLKAAMEMQGCFGAKFTLVGD